MAKDSGFSIGRFILQLALGLMLAISGIWSLANNKGDAAVAALRSIFDGDAEKIIVLIFSVIEMLAGILLIVELFAGDKFGKFDNLLGIIIIVVWAIAIVLMDFLNGNFLKPDVLPWLYNLAGHCVVLGALIYLND